MPKQSPIADSEIASQRLLPTTMGIASQKPLAMTPERLPRNDADEQMNCKGCILAGIALLLVGLLTLGVFTITAGHFLATEDAFSQADSIVVLGGDGGGVFRVRHGVDLFNAGYAPVVVFSGGTIEQGSEGAGETG